MSEWMVEGEGCGERRRGGGEGEGEEGGGRLERAAWSVGGGIANAFFNSLERYSCVGLAVTDSDDEEGGGAGESLQNKARSRLGMGLDKSDETSGIGALRLVGCERFVRQNPNSDRFAVQRFHHVEFWYLLCSSTSCALLSWSGDC